MRRLCYLLAIVVLAVMPCRGQAPADTLRHPAVVPLAVGAGMLAEGGLSRALADYGDITPRRERNSVVTEVGQYVPLAFPWAMKAFGAPTRSGWGRMAVSQGTGALLMAAAVYGGKDVVGAWRPDGSDRRSFPSGHTAWAFLGATATAIELADLSPWYAVGAYALATGIAVERVTSYRHAPADVIAGAGIGMFAAGVGYLVGDLIFRNPLSCTVTPAPYRGWLTVYTAMAWSTTALHVGDTRVHLLPALQAGARALWRIDEHWSAGLTAGYMATPLRQEDTFLANLNSVELLATAGYSLPVSRRLTLQASAAAGYRKHLSLRVADVSANAGTPVGRLSVGAVMPLTRRFSCRAALGCELAHLRLTLPQGTAAATSPTLLLELASRLSF